MMMEPSTLNKEELEKSSFELMYNNYKLAENLKDPEKLCKKKQDLAKQYGVYFWTLVTNEREYAVYIGQTKSLESHLENHSADFKIHAPNDHKIRFFQQAITSKEISEKLGVDEESEVKHRLYYAVPNKDACVTHKNECIKLFKPIMNKLPPATEEISKLLAYVYQLHYSACLERLLQSK